MFTGIITNLGKVTAKSRNQFTVQTDEAFCNKIEKGSSVSVNGACLTVSDKEGLTSFILAVMSQTVKKTMIQTLTIGDTVNLELPISANSLFSGHIILGHIDGVGILTHISTQGSTKVLSFEIPDTFSKYIVENGSIALNGISLTVIDVQKFSFSVAIIPYTWEHTMLYKIHIGDFVNVETDIIAKYVEKLLTRPEDIYETNKHN